MKTTKRIRSIAAFVMAITLLAGAMAFGTTVRGAEGSSELTKYLNKAEAALSSYDVDGATRFTFSDDSVAVSGGSGTGYSIEGTAIKIDAGGTYVLDGSCADGSVTVKKETTGVVLVLNGLELASKTTAPLAFAKSSEAVVIAAEGTVNALSDSELNNNETHTDNLDAENAVIKCKDGSDIILTGKGTLNVTANGKNGVKGGASTETEGDASLTIHGLTLNITASVNDALSADNLLNILGGSLTIDAADDAIKSELVLNVGAEGIDGPTITINSCSEGIEAATINIFSGKIDLHATDDGINAANSDLTGYSFACNIYGGEIRVDSEAGDGIDSNGTFTLAGGEVTINSSPSGDNSPIDSEGTFSITGGTLLAIGAAGMGQAIGEASQSYASFGGTGFGGFGFGNFGGQRGSAGTGSTTDAATSETPAANGGEPPAPPDSARIPSGQLPSGQLPSGQMPNGQMPGGTGALNLSAGDALSITDANGNVLISETALRSASYVFFSSPALEDGGTLTLLVNGEAAASAAAGKQTSPMQGGFGGREMRGDRVRQGGTDGSGTLPGSGTIEQQALSNDSLDSSSANRPSVLLHIALAAAAFVALSSTVVLVIVLRRAKRTAQAAQPVLSEQGTEN